MSRADDVRIVNSAFLGTAREAANSVGATAFVVLAIGRSGEPCAFVTECITAPELRRFLVEILKQIDSGQVVHPKLEDN